MAFAVSGGGASGRDASTSSHNAAASTVRRVDYTHEQIPSPPPAQSAQAIPPFPPPRSKARNSLRTAEPDRHAHSSRRSDSRTDSDTLPPSLFSASVPSNAPSTKHQHSSSSRDDMPRRSSGRNTPDWLTPEPWDPHKSAPSSAPTQSPTIPSLSPARSRPHSGSQRTAHGNASSTPSRTPQRSRRASSHLSVVYTVGVAGSQQDITALPAMADAEKATPPPSPVKPPHLSPAATKLYTVSYLIFFAVWGTLARVGLQTLTFYPGAPVIFSELWANVAGTFIMGFLAEDRALFRDEWGGTAGEEQPPEPLDRPAEHATTTGTKNQKADDRAAAAKRHSIIKKTIPLYIGLATGFCGSFTSFSSFMRDAFLALSNDLSPPTPHPFAHPPYPINRSQGFSVLALPATLLLTLATCFAALTVGAHLASSLARYTPTLPFRFTRHALDPAFVLLGPGCWLAAILLSVFPPAPSWRPTLFAAVFAPPGCLARFYISQLLNPRISSFPLGTFTVNILGTAVLGVAYDLQRVPLHGMPIPGGGKVGCAVLQGVMDGFCGSLTTVSTWIAEMRGARRGSGYVYGGISVVVGLGVCVCVMGGVRWSVGWESVVC